MYNIIDVYKKRRTTQVFCCSILLTNKELESILSGIYFAKDADGFYAPKNDSLTQKERRQIFNKFPSIPYINDVSFSICLSDPPKGTFLNHYHYIWHHEIGVVEKRSNKNRLIGFVHPVTNRLLFKDISQ